MSNYGESAAIKMPEVGDVWQDENGRQYFIFKKSRKYVHLIVKRLRYKTGFSITQRSKESITNRWFFEGKSIINLHDMFKVKSFDEKQYYKEMFGEEND